MCILTKCTHSKNFVKIGLKELNLRRRAFAELPRLRGRAKIESKPEPIGEGLDEVLALPRGLGNSANTRSRRFNFYSKIPQDLK